MRTDRLAFGPSKPSRLALMGIRFIEGEDGGTPPAPTPEPPKPAAPAQETDWQAEAEKLKAESRKWEARAKENSDAAKRLAEIEEANKTAEEKAAERLAAAEKRASELEVQALRAEVAASKGVPSLLLTGTTKEDLEASADALVAFRGEQPQPTPEKKTYVIPDEGGVPAIGKSDDITPGMGSLRAAYAQTSEGK